MIRPHAGFNDATGSPVTRGAKAEPLLHAKHALMTGASPASATTPDPEVLGFAQNGEVSSGAWTSDLRFDLLSTIAYFSVDVNANGTINTSDSDYATWRSSQMTSLMNTAHNAGDRVVLTITAFDDNTIGGATGSETARQTLINAVINELVSRGGDGVNVDFEGVSSGLASNFTTFVAELYSALKSRVPQQSYLTVDTYASASLGGTMYDLAGLLPHLDAFDVMEYGFSQGGEATPTAPLHGYWYNVTQSINDYQHNFGIPPSKLIMGVPYYGYKWSVSKANPGNDGMQPGTAPTADSYADALADFSCAENLTYFWDSTFDEPYATWWSPATNDPCGGDHNSWRELYYENAQSLGDKFDLVNAEGLRGIGIWALGFDSGSNDLWNEIALKFSVTHAPAATVNALPSTESSTRFTVSWASTPGSPRAARYILWAQDQGQPWIDYVTTPSTSATVFGFPGHTYSFYVEAIGLNGYDSGGPAASQASTTVASNAAPAMSEFTSMYAVSGDGTLEPGSSPPLGMSEPFGWDIARGVALDTSGQGGVILDGWGGLHAFGDTTTVNGTTWWPGWDIARGVAETSGNRGYVLDGWGGVHPFSTNGASLPAAPQHMSGFWPGMDIARGIALFGDGTGGVVLDAWGGIHPFTVSGDTQAAAAPQGTAYWPGWNIARGIVVLPGSTYTHYSGYTVDGFGGVHPFGGAPPVQGDSSYWPGWDIATGLTLLPGSSSAGYVLDAWGGMHAFGGAPAVVTPRYQPGQESHGPSVH